MALPRRQDDGRGVRLYRHPGLVAWTADAAWVLLYRQLEMAARARPEEVQDRTGRVINCIHYSIELLGDPYVRMCYEDPRSGGFYDYNVDLVSTGANYGGLRWWFLCPVVVAGRACRRRVRKLYLAPGWRYFGCRRCSDLCYTSQREDDMTRALSKAQAIRVRLGGSAGMDQLFPAKPRRMRWTTYRLLRARSEELWVQSLSAALGHAVPALGDDTNCGDR